MSSGQMTQGPQGGGQDTPLNCPRCGREIPFKSQFCIGCGLEVQPAAPEVPVPPASFGPPSASGTACPKCGAQVEPRAGFCVGCGYRVTGPPRKKAFAIALGVAALVLIGIAATVVLVLILGENGPRFKEHLIGTIPVEDYISDSGGNFVAVSPDTTKLAYRAKDGDKWLIVEDGTKGPRFDNVGPPVFSPDGKQLVYVVNQGGKSSLIVNGREEDQFDVRGVVVLFSPDGGKMAFVATAGGKDFVVVNGTKVTPDYDSIPSDALPALAFSADGGQMAYAATQGGKSFVVSAGERGPEFDWVGRPALSRDGGTVAYGAAIGTQNYVVVNGKLYDAADKVRWVTFNKKASKLAYPINGDRAHIVVLDLATSQSKPESRDFGFVGQPAFSPDGDKVAYLAQDDKTKKVNLVAGAEIGPVLDEVGLGSAVFGPEFNSSGSRVAYCGIINRAVWWKVMDVR
ncbi:MAG TPA: zinc ribbon domain-containing protein [Blastocatellia bacterium]|nr:zinc ribbon domain-containing protein [Blastocatellia bacterium]